jgi:hypothetical protein
MAFVAALLVCAVAAASDWSSDFNAALEKAKKDGLPVLLRLTGDMPACKVMDDIVAKKEFDNTLAGYVLVTLDVEKVEVDKDGMPVLPPALLNILVESGIGGYPAFVVFDFSADGDPRAIAVQLGLTDAASAVQFMDNANISRKVRDKNLQDYTKATAPVEKAAALHAALLSVKDYGNVFASGSNYGYRKVMEEMEKIDPDSKSGGTAFWVLYRLCNAQYENAGKMKDAVDLFIKRFAGKDKENVQLGYYFKARTLTVLATEDDVLSEEEKQGVIACLEEGVALAPLTRVAESMKRVLEIVKNWPTGKPGAKTNAVAE